MKSPISPVRQVLLAVYVAMILGLLLNARSIERDANQMPDGLMRSTTLLAGRAALWVADPLRLTWPRDQIDTALGNQPQSAVPPLLQASDDEVPPVVVAHAPAPSPTTMTTRVPTTPARRTVNMAASAGLQRPAVEREQLEPSATPSRSMIISPAPTPLILRSSTTFGPGSEWHGLWHDDGPACTPARDQCGETHKGAALALAAGAIALVRAPMLPSRTATPRPTTTQSPRPTATARPTITPGPPLRHVSTAHPLRLLVTGDSLMEYAGPDLVDLAGKDGMVQGSVDIHYGTGLARPDFVDWSLVAKQQTATYHPDVVVVLMGGNDAQNMVLANGQIVYQGTKQWLQEYRRRARICMRTWLQGGVRRIYWLSMPPARSSVMAATEEQMDVALREAAATIPGMQYLNIVPLVTNHGAYADALLIGGTWTYVRAADGIHLSPGGAERVAEWVFAVIRRQWHFK